MQYVWAQVVAPSVVSKIATNEMVEVQLLGFQGLSYQDVEWKHADDSIGHYIKLVENVYYYISHVCIIAVHLL